MHRSFNDRILIGGFCAFKVDLAPLVETFLEWQNKKVLSTVPDEVTAELLSNTPDHLLDLIDPLVSPVITKWLFLEIGKGWVLAVDNGQGGTDAGIASVLSGKCACFSVRGLSVPHTFNIQSGAGRYGAEIFEAYLNGIEQRTVYCANDGGRWKFGQSGAPYPIEDASLYSQKLTRNRFSRKEFIAIMQYLEVPIPLSGEEAIEKKSAFLAKRIMSHFAEYKEHAESFGEF